MTRPDKHIAYRKYLERIGLVLLLLILWPVLFIGAGVASKGFEEQYES